MRPILVLALAALAIWLLRRRSDAERPEIDDPYWYAWRDTRPDSLLPWDRMAS